LNKKIPAGYNGDMAGFVRARPHAVAAAYLIISVSVVFLLAAVEPIRSFGYETLGLGYGSGVTSGVAACDYSTVAPEFVQNGFENTLSILMPEPLRFFVSSGGCVIVTAIFKASASGKIRTDPVDKKNSLLLKLRI
jgi:hypothetical protein